jgi:hypothetical protein
MNYTCITSKGGKMNFLLRGAVEQATECVGYRISKAAKLSKEEARSFKQTATIVFKRMQSDRDDFKKAGAGYPEAIAKTLINVINAADKGYKKKCDW